VVSDFDFRPASSFPLQKSYNPPSVRILLLSDIHSNLEALDACLAATPAHDLVVNLGDTVGYGANPNGVIARAQALGKVFVRGNHDRAACGLMSIDDFNPAAGLATLWTRGQLTAENLAWLRSLPQGPVRLDELPGIEFVHGSPLDEDEYIVSVQDALDPLLANPVPVTFFGHTHLQGGFVLASETSEAYRPVYRTVGQPESSAWPLLKNKDKDEKKNEEKDKNKDKDKDKNKNNDHRYLINPGSVGQPRDGDWRAAFAVFDSETWIVTFYRVPYNLRTAQEKILAANLPQRLATRLATGR
jgi:diadenosine tetraphosphatase ApaH/serine/threonine PP2A family protein phosphatase